jgi:hypothetical protein
MTAKDDLYNFYIISKNNTYVWNSPPTRADIDAIPFAKQSDENAKRLGFKPTYD